MQKLSLTPISLAIIGLLVVSTISLSSILSGYPGTVQIKAPFGEIIIDGRLPALPPEQ